MRLIRLLTILLLAGCRVTPEETPMVNYENQPLKAQVFVEKDQKKNESARRTKARQFKSESIAIVFHPNRA